MPSHQHEILIEMFRDRPSLAAELLRGPLHVAVPDFDEVRLSAGDLTDVTPTEYRADAVVTLVHKGITVLAVVIEVQLRVDGRKRRSWPAYVATLHARQRCPVALMVVCPDQAVADWCAAPISFGPPGSVLTPVALGPGQVPVVTDLDLARRLPELAVLSALAHGARPDPRPVFAAVLPAAARKCLEEFMTVIPGYRYQSEFARRYFNEGEAQGKAQGEADALLAILDARGIDVPDKIRAEIAGCTDLDRLDGWIRQAATAHRIEDLDL